MIGLLIISRLRTLAFAALALAVFGAIECPPFFPYVDLTKRCKKPFRCEESPCFFTYCNRRNAANDNEEMNGTRLMEGQVIVFSRRLGTTRVYRVTGNDAMLRRQPAIKGMHVNY